MSWKSVCLVAVMFAFSASLMAQNTKDPFVGVWQLRPSGSGPQRIQTITNVPNPDGGYTSVRANVTPGSNMNSSERHPVVYDGKPHDTIGGDQRKITYKRIDANTVERTHDRNGKLAVDTTTVSKDGKTMTIKNAANVRVYDKLFDLQPVR